MHARSTDRGSYLSESSPEIFVSRCFLALKLFIFFAASLMSIFLFLYILVSFSSDDECTLENVQLCFLLLFFMFQLVHQRDP